MLRTHGLRHPTPEAQQEQTHRQNAAYTWDGPNGERYVWDGWDGILTDAGSAAEPQQRQPETPQVNREGGQVYTWQGPDGQLYLWDPRLEQWVPQ